MISWTEMKCAFCHEWSTLEEESKNILHLNHLPLWENDKEKNWFITDLSISCSLCFLPQISKYVTTREKSLESFVSEKIEEAMRDPKIISNALMTLSPEGRNHVRVLLDALEEYGHNG